MVVEKIGNDKLEGVKVVLTPVEIGELLMAVNAKVDNRMTLIGTRVVERFVENILSELKITPLYSYSE